MVGKKESIDDYLEMESELVGNTLKYPFPLSEEKWAEVQNKEISDRVKDFFYTREEDRIILNIAINKPEALSGGDFANLLDQAKNFLT